MSLTPIEYKFLLVPIGSLVPVFPGGEEGYDVLKQVPREKHQAVGDFEVPLMKRLAKLREIGKRGLEGMDNTM